MDTREVEWDNSIRLKEQVEREKGCLRIDPVPIHSQVRIYYAQAKCDEKHFSPARYLRFESVAKTEQMDAAPRR